MNIEERIRFLLRAASRAEGEGDDWVAHLFRRMAEEAVPPDSEQAMRLLRPTVRCQE